MKKTLGRAISSVMIITLICRFFALVANQFYLSYFGASNLELNIYSYAISMPNIIFNSIGTGISTVIIPIFAALIVKKQHKEANLFVSNILTIFGSIILCLTVIGLAVSPILPKFTDFNQGYSYDFAVKSLMIIMPVMIFYGISYIFQGVLQSLGQFSFPAAVSLPSSIVIITYVLLFADKYGVIGLLWATFIGLSLQGLMLIPPAIKSGFRFSLVYDLKNLYIKEAFSLIGPILIGSGAFQINMLYNITLMANFENSVTLLTFVQNLVLNSVLAIVYSVTAVLYPKMTSFIAENDKTSYTKTLTDGISGFVFLFLPASVGITMVRTPLLNLISGYGKITAQDINTAGIFLSIYAFAFTSIAVKELLDRAFFANKNTKIPAICGFITIISNVVLSQIFIRQIGSYGIPLAYLSSSLCAMSFLAFKIRKYIGKYPKNTVKTLFISLISSAIMAIVLYFTSFISPNFGGFIGKIIALAFPVVVGGVVYGLCSIIFKNPVAMSILKR